MAFTREGGIPSFISGDRVIQFFPRKQMRRAVGTIDIPTSAAFMQDEDQIKHIGELGFFGQRTTTSKPFTIDILENRQVMETGADGTFHYDVPFYENAQCVVMRDTSDQKNPGQDEGTFKLVLSEEFKPGDVLTTDMFYGQEVYVTDEQVLQKGDTFEHIVTLMSKDRKEIYNSFNLKEGVTYFKSYNVLGGERDTILSGVRMPNQTSKLTCEFRLGSGSGVELDVSAAANIGNQIGTSFKDGFIKELNMDYDQFMKTWGEVAVVMDRDPQTGMAIKESARLTEVAEWLVKREHLRIIDNRAMFAKGGRITTTSGYVDIAEGLWFQLKRGKNIPYSRKGGITRNHIKEAVEYIFQGNDHIQPEDRHIKFKAGKYAYENINAIFSTEFNDQMGRLSNLTNLLGTDGQIPKSPISGPLDALTLSTVKIAKVMLPGIGNVEIEHDIALDQLGNQADRLAAGMHPQGKSHGSYAMIIWDARNQAYSNNQYVPKGTEYIEGADESSSVCLVKKPGDMIISGRTHGYYDPHKTSDILSSGNKQRFVDFWSWDTGAAYFLKDPSSFLMIHLQESDKRGYN